MRQFNARWMAREIGFQFIGLPYIWGGDDPVEGMDCSGLCVELLKSVGILPREGDWSSRGLFREFKDCETTRLLLGCLVFYSSKSRPDYITHVEFCLDDMLALGASGGGSKTVDEAAAIKHNAYTKVRPIERDRPIVGYVDPFKRLDK